MRRYLLNGEYLVRIWRAVTLANTSCLAALPGCPHMPGPAGLVAAFLLPLQQVLEGAAAGCRVRPAWPGLLELGAVPIRPADLDQFTLKQLEPAPLLISFLAQEQMAAVGADL